MYFALQIFQSKKLHMPHFNKNQQGATLQCSKKCTIYIKMKHEGYCNVVIVFQPEVQKIFQEMQTETQQKVELVGDR